MLGFRGTCFAVAGAEFVRDNVSTDRFSLSMADTGHQAPLANGVNTSAGHLSVRVEGLHPVDLPFLFERQQPKRMGASLVGSFAFQALFATLLIFASRHVAESPGAFLPTLLNSDIVWLAEPGPGGGGGGGGNKMPEPPRQAELPGKDKITVPVEKPPALEPPKEKPKEEPPEIAQLIIPAKTMGAAENTQPGIIDPGPPTVSQGTGTSGGVGSGAGSGIGPGTGSGLGPGSGGGTGGGVYQPGNGVTPPVPTYVPKPQYTADAMRARVQGVVLVECVVQTNGQCSDTRVVRSLDPTFGLDQEAVKAARLFRFRPGMRQGEPVAVLVTIELSFSLH
jgi:periplasmic protein TonB